MQETFTKENKTLTNHSRYLYLYYPGHRVSYWAFLIADKLLSKLKKGKINSSTVPKWTPCEGTNLHTAEGKSLLFKSCAMGPHLLTFAMPSFVEMEKLKGEQRGVRQWTGPKPPGGGEQPDAEQRCQDTWQSSRSFLTPHCWVEYHCSSGPRTTPHVLLDVHVYSECPLAPWKIFSKCQYHWESLSPSFLLSSAP